MNNIILTAHIIGAILSLLYVVVGTLQIVINKGNLQFSKYAAIIISIYQIFSGGLLLLINPGASILAVCGKGLAMIVLVFSVHLLLSYRLRQRCSV